MDVDIGKLSASMFSPAKVVYISFIVLTALKILPMPSAPPGSWWGAGVAAGPSFLVSPFSISTIAGPSGAISAGGGIGVVGGGGSLSTSGALTLTAGWGAGAEVGVSPQGGNSWFIPFCHD